jgi:hypothetical protein
MRQGESTNFLHKMPHIKAFLPKPADQFSFQLPRSHLIYTCKRRVPPGVWDIDIYDMQTTITHKNQFSDLSGDDCVMKCRLLIDSAVKFGAYGKKW